MRDLIDRLTLLESTGLSGRKSGDIFRDSSGNQLIFSNITFYPEGGGKYDSDKLDEVLLDIMSATPEIIWQNKRSSKTGGFAIASFSNEQGMVYVGRYFDLVKPAAFDNYMPNSFGDFRLASRAAVKVKAGLMPQDLLSETENLSIKDIMVQLSVSLGTDHPLYAVAHAIATGQKLPITFPAPEGISFTAFSDYFCEILQPMALQNGLYTGTAARAAEIFLDGGFAGTTITFDDSKNAGLSDSILTSDSGQIIKVSTKSGKGAEASTRNLIDAIEEIKHLPDGQKLLKKYSKTIDMISQIQQEGQAGAPLYLGVEFGVISEQEAHTIESLKNQALVDISDLSKINLSPNLKKLIKNRNTDTPSKTNLYYHLMAAVAFEAAAKVNAETDFSHVATQILSQGALVQVYTKATEGKGTWTLNGFDTRWPGLGIKGVYISASKNYFSTQIKGNFTFKIDRGNGIDTTNATPATPMKDIEDVAPDIVSGRAMRQHKPKTPAPIRAKR